MDDALRNIGGSAPNPWSGGGGDVPVGGLVTVGALLAAGGAGVYALSRRNRRRHEEEQRASLEKLRVVVDEDITAFGEELDRLDFHPAEPGADDAMRTDYAHALDAYEQSKRLMAEARKPEDVRGVTQAVEDGRFALARLAARREGRPLPERRPPCFFVTCATAPRRRRHLDAPGRRRPRGPGLRGRPGPPHRRPRPDGPRGRHRLRPPPLLDAGPAYGPWVGGYFGGGLLPGLLVGTMLGGMMAGPAYAADYGAGYGDFGGYEGGYVSGADFDGGDFGGGFGGGDFGGVASAGWWGLRRRVLRGGRARFRRRRSAGGHGPPSVWPAPARGEKRADGRGGTAAQARLRAAGARCVVGRCVVPGPTPRAGGPVADGRIPAGSRTPGSAGPRASASPR
ncbi:hypothetical protein SGRIM128S_07405 [Streptomyces griseomycini]